MLIPTKAKHDCPVHRIEDNLDQWGRPKKAMLRMPTEALPEDDRRSLPQVEVCT